MPEQNNGRKPFRRNSSGAENGFRRGGEAGGTRRPDGESGGERGAARAAGAPGDFRREGGRRSDIRGSGAGDRAPQRAEGNRPRPDRGNFAGDDSRRPDRGAGRDRAGDKPGERGGFRPDSARGRQDNRSGGFGGRDARTGGDRPERGFRERGDQRPQGGFRSGDGDRGGFRGSGPGRGEGRGPREDRGFGGRGDAGRPERTGDRPQRGPAATGGGPAGGGYSRSGDAGPRRRGGEGAARGLDRRPPRPDEPDLPDDIQAADLDGSIRRDLLSLDKGNAETVARHLAMAAQMLDDDPRLALAHARAARQRAGRIAVVRETAGVVAYHAGEWAEALSELRAARRMAGGTGLLAVMADCERGLGRPERAIEIGRSDEGRALTGDEAIELRIVVAGARMDLGQYDQAVVTLQTADLDPARTGSGPARLFYAYADALVAAGRTDEGLTWFFNAAAADLDGETDAEERAAELTGEL